MPTKPRIAYITKTTTSLMALPLPLVLLLLILSLSDPIHATIRKIIGTCHASSYLHGKGSHCSTPDDPDCCQAGELYPQYNCSPPVSAATAATMYVGSLQEGGGGGAEAACDGKFHNDTDPVVSMSTGWFDDRSRCLRDIRIRAANGRSVAAKVVDECDSLNGCGPNQGYNPPCEADVIYASPAVWEELGVPISDESPLNVTWSDEQLG